MTEEWRPVFGWSGYEVSSEGRVRSWRSWRGASRAEPYVLSPKKKGSARYRRLYVTLCGERGRKNLHVHAIVLEAFVGPRPAGLLGCHNNGDATDNRVTNLRWDTQKGNMSDRVAHGTHARGERCSTAKLTEIEVGQIRAHRGWLSQAHLGVMYGVTQGTVSFIHRGITWSH